ncbi:MAG: hypothetical protein LBU64_10230 [Planctomycetota bacterium]|jgi:hypothetical protein|nr:hypothetical protein [Planctomycetota bacterium]
MADFLSDLDRLKALAAGAKKAPPLKSGDVRRRIRGRRPLPLLEEEPPPLRLIGGMGLAAALAACLVLLFSFQAWRDLANPLAMLSALPDIASFLGA